MTFYRFAIAFIVCVLFAANSAAQTAGSVFDTFDAALPGYGDDAYLTDQKIIHDMALCWYTVGVADMGNVSQSIISAEQILALSEKNPGKPGWGLGFSYDAFSDGSTNNAGTVYGVTTAICVRALFDVYDLTGDQKYFDRAVVALDYYNERSFVQSSTGPNGGFFYYSNQSYDWGQTVHNVTALLMGQYARAWDYTNNPVYKDVAERSARYLWARQEVATTGIKWPYGYADHAPFARNDEVHAAFIVQGFIDYEKYLPPIADITPAVDYLEYMSSTMPSRVQRLWGTGMMIYTLTEAGRMSAANSVISDVLPSHVGLAWETDEVESYVRHTSYLLAGLARHEALAQ